MLFITMLKYIYARISAIDACRTNCKCGKLKKKSKRMCIPIIFFHQKLYDKISFYWQCIQIISYCSMFKSVYSNRQDYWNWYILIVKLVNIDK